MQDKAINVLRIESSSRINNSYSRRFTNDVINRIRLQFKTAHIVERDIRLLPFLSETAVEAMFIPEGARTITQKDSLLLSDQLIEELQWSDVIVMGVPIYNFSVPAALKAYFDLIVRIEKTFVHTEEGSRGLVHGKKAYVVITSAGTKFKSKVDFTSPYIEFIFSFVGIRDVSLINATNIDSNDKETVVSEINRQLEELEKGADVKAVA